MTMTEQLTTTAEPTEALLQAESRKSVLRRLWAAAGTLVTCAAVLVSAAAVVVSVASHLSPSGEYTIFGHPVMTIVSGSMTPTIRTGALVIDDAISKTEAAHLHVGQIISFRRGTDVFTHRIHAIEEINGSVAYQTKGDANNAPDVPLVSPKQIVGRYSYNIPDGGYVIYALHKPVTLILLLASPVLWLISVWLYRRGKDADKSDQVSHSPGKRGAAAM